MESLLSLWVLVFVFWTPFWFLVTVLLLAVILNEPLYAILVVFFFYIHSF
uniref:Uncharacterized protein n=1 Tax=Rhizophora mucronata TaxID=61149 RepID=A0A2P2LBW4_RHIMU